jgi:hypothetical protein
MRLTIGLGVILFGLLLFVQPAAAQTDLFLYGGVQSPGRITLNNALSTGASGGSQIINDPFNVGVFGVRISHGKVWGGEHSVGFAPNFLDSSSKAIIYNSGFRILAPLPIVQPYGGVGAGAVTSWGQGASNIGTRFALHYGGGVRIIPEGVVGAQLDVRGYTLPSVQDQTLNIAEVAAGIVIRF